jgi:hypothetical protein
MKLTVFQLNEINFILSKDSLLNYLILACLIKEVRVKCDKVWSHVESAYICFQVRVSMFLSLFILNLFPFYLSISWLILFIYLCTINALLVLSATLYYIIICLYFPSAIEVAVIIFVSFISWWVNKSTLFDIPHFNV